MNKSETKTSIFSLIILLVLALALVFLVYKFLTPQKKLPVYNPQDMNPDLVDSTLTDVKEKAIELPISN
jgi:protein SCO1/2